MNKCTCRSAAVITGAVHLPGLQLARRLDHVPARAQRNTTMRRGWARAFGRCLPPSVLIVLLQGCATQLDTRGARETDAPNAVPLHRALLFQRSSIAPESDGAFLSPAALQPGDIILTSGKNLVSASIQLLTLAPVSHAAIHVGDRRVVEAVGSGVRVRPLDELIRESRVALVLRHPELSAEQSRSISDYALQKTGTRFNFLGVTLHVPFSVKRRVCELPLVPPTVRDACLRSIGVIHYLAASERQLFCSQLILQAYQHSGVPITDADPRLLNPADILHMREGDVPSVRIRKQLRYVGHLKYEPAVVATVEQ